MSELINRVNYEDVQEFLRYQLTVRQLDEKTVRSAWSRLRHLLEWCGATPFGQCKKRKATFPSYLEGKAARDGNPFGGSHLADVFKATKLFFKWAREHLGRRYKGIDDEFLESLRAHRSRREESEWHERQLYTVEEAIQLASFAPRTLTERRTGAMAALLFISGMRIGAAMTLPIGCVDLKGLRVHQLPERGVHTKNYKAGITPLLNIPELLRRAQEWDDLVRPALGEGAFWFAKFDPFGALDPVQGNTGNRDNRRIDYARDLRELCVAAGVAYKSPHKLRHGFAVYSLKRANGIGELKAISQALMHSTIGITDGIYGRLVDDDVHRVVTGLSREVGDSSLERMIEEAVRKALNR